MNGVANALCTPMEEQPGLRMDLGDIVHQYTCLIGSLGGRQSLTWQGYGIDKASNVLSDATDRIRLALDYLLAKEGGFVGSSTSQIVVYRLTRLEKLSNN